MKLYYVFERIDSVSNKILIKCYGQEVFVFNKTDFENWKNLEGQKNVLNPCLVASLDKIETYGEESHAVRFSLKDKVNWFNFARNKIRDDFLTNKERTTEIDLTKPVQIYNKEAFEKASDFSSLLSQAASFLGADVLLDLSNIVINPNFVDSTSPYGYCNDGSYSISNSSGGNRCCFSNLQILHTAPKLPDNLTSLDYAFYNCRNLTDISNIDFKKILSAKLAFATTSIEDYPSLPETLTNRTQMFGQTKIKYVPGISIKSDSDILLSNCFRNCADLISVGDINIEGNGYVDNCFYNCSNLSSVGNIYIKKVVNPVGVFSGVVHDISIGNVYIEDNNATGALPQGIFTSSTQKTPLFSIESINAPANCLTDLVPTGQHTNGARYVDCIEYLGPILCKPASIILNTVSTLGIKKIVAFPQCYASSGVETGFTSSFRCSTGNEIWVDYTNTEKEVEGGFVRCITDINRTVDEHIDTATKHYTDRICLDVIKAKDSYPYEFDLNGLDLTRAQITVKTVTNDKNIAATVTPVIDKEDNKIYVDLDYDNLTDSSIVTNKYTITHVIYDATINGHPFRGRVAKMTLEVSTSFTVTEEASAIFSVEYEDGDEQIEVDSEETE